MGESDGGVHKHLKSSPETPSDRPGWPDAVRSRSSAATAKAVAVAGAGGAGVWLIAVVTHHRSAAAALGACSAFAVGYVAACVQRYLKVKPAITAAKAKAQSSKIRAETQRSLMLMAAEDPARAQAIERMLVLQNQAALIDEAEKLGEHAVPLAAHLAGQRPGRQPSRNPPGNKGGGTFPRAV
jgi:hypothetical protein